MPPALGRMVADLANPSPLGKAPPPKKTLHVRVDARPVLPRQTNLAFVRGTDGSRKCSRMTYSPATGMESRLVGSLFPRHESMLGDCMGDESTLGDLPYNERDNRLSVGTHERETTDCSPRPPACRRVDPRHKRPPPRDIFLCLLMWSRCESGRPAEALRASHTQGPG
eukprot:365636-Chlamydomonas_euryale.AAC.13